MRVLKPTVSAAALIAVLLSQPAAAQASGNAPAEASDNSTSVIMDDIVVTARKRSAAENVQSVPIAMTALSAEQIEAKQIRDLGSLGYGLPNVAMDTGGTFKGTANFSIRGLGVNASVPTLEPSVGVFVDGVYLGVTAGVVMDLFDLQQIEVLRGPQGLLFGKNVTGGAVLINTARPTSEFTAKAKVGVETGPSWTAAASVSGPLTQGMNVKLAGYFNKDEGWFRNSFDNSQFGKQETFIVRPAVEFKPSEDVSILIRGEYGEQDGDGAAAQNFNLFSRNSFGFSQNTPAINKQKWYQITGQFDWDVGFGDGTITNIAGYRNFRQQARVDIDATPAPGNDSYTDLAQHQFSNELRYAGRFADRVSVTTGLYYFEQQINYQDNRRAGNGANRVYSGGIQDSQAYAWFSAVDVDLTDTLTLNTGLRYAYEKKRVQIATQPLNTNLIPANIAVSPAIIPPGACDVINRRCTFDFFDSASFDGWVPKIGFQWKPNSDNLIYGFWTRGLRGGGYNVRSGSTTIPPGPFGDEVLDSFEVGNKSRFFDRRLTLNTAFFFNKIKDLQRSVILPDPALGTVTLIRNTADAEIWGFEVDARVLLTNNFVVFASAGYTKGDYTKVAFDLNGDRVINDRDLALRIPRLSPWSTSIGFNYDQKISGLGNASLSADYSYRDRSFYNDSNTGFLNIMHQVNANLSLKSESGAWTVSVYGKNLLNKVQFAGVTPLAGAGGTFAPLEKGRIIGADFRIEF